MTRFFMTAGLLASTLATANIALADPSPSLAAFLQVRVPDELAVGGVVLSRRNVTLRIDTAGAGVVVSLVDGTTGRVVASTAIDQLPDDREAAVATVTHAAAELANQIGPQTLPPDLETRSDRDHHEALKLEFRRDSIRFGNRYWLSYDANGYPEVERHWTIFQGEFDHEIDPDTFYREVGHPELAARYDANRSAANNILIGSAVTVAVGVGLFTYGAAKSGDNCNLAQGDGAFSACVMAGPHISPALYLGVVATLVGGGLMLYGGYRRYHAQPISEDQAMSLAHAYNDSLRHRLELPTADQARLPVSSLQLAPFASATDGGLALAGTF